jgi:hypothetical protein
LRLSRKSLYLLLALLFFLAARVALLRTPLGSDDVQYFRAAQDLLDGNHPLETHTPSGPLPHRLGIVVPTAMAIAALGPGLAAYYLPSVVFALGGALTVALILRARASPSAAIVVLLLHAVLPFEVQHASTLLPNVPAGVAGLLTVLLIAQSGEQFCDIRRVLRHGVGAGVLAFLVYSLRDKEVAFLLPALVLASNNRGARKTAGVSIITLLALILGEQAIYLMMGHPWGTRWAILEAEHRAYWPQLERVNALYFLARPVLFAARDFGAGGVLGIGSLVCAHAVVLRYCRDRVVWLLAAYGVTHAVAMNYYVFGLDGGQLVVLPSAFRYYQPFYFSGLLAVGWILAAAAREARPMFRAFLLGGCALAALVSGVTSFSFEDRIADPGSPFRRVQAAFEQCPGAGGVVAGCRAHAAPFLSLVTTTAEGRPVTWTNDPSAPNGDCRFVVVQWERELFSCGFYGAAEDSCRHAWNLARTRAASLPFGDAGSGIFVYGPLEAAQWRQVMESLQPSR